MKISRKDLDQLIDAILAAELRLVNGQGLRISARTTSYENREAAALGILSIRQGCSVTCQDTIELPAALSQ